VIDVVYCCLLLKILCLQLVQYELGCRRLRELKLTGIDHELQVGCAAVFSISNIFPPD
jgi:hypothetical protein